MPAQRRSGPNLDDYIQVNQRIESFYEKYPDGSLRAEIVFDDGKAVVMKAYAYRFPDDPHPATGHAEEIRGEGMVNKTSALENCETSAVGRAIAMAGFHVSKSVASREEVEQAIAEEKRQEALPTQLAVERAKALRDRIVQASLVDEAKMKLTSLGVEKLEDLPEDKAVDFSHWLSQQAEKKAAAA